MKKLFASAAFTLSTIAMTGLVQAQDKSDWPQSISIGTASQGGVYFVYGNGLAGFIGESLGISASGEVTGGPQQNATLVQMGEQTIGLVTMGPMFEAWSGKSSLAPDVEHTDVRALFPMYETPFHAIAMTKSNIESMKDLEGKRISVGPQGGTSSIYWPRFLEALGVNAQINYSGASDAAGQLKDGLIDAFTFSAGIPVGAFSQLSAEADVKTFAFNEEELATILEQFPEVAPFTIPGGTYSVQPDDQQSVAMWNFAVAHKDMPESLAYEITKLVMENNDRMKSIHAAAAKTIPENWDKNSFLPYHKGAVKYFNEIGIEIPENLQAE